tara:strand:- start:217 stop:531 length:315 start_codon:yes stop_codon:yes gene_type:complete
MRKVEKKELYGFWKAIDEENENEIHIVFRENGKAHFSESKNDHETFIGEFEMIQEGAHQVIKIDAEKEIKVIIKHSWIHENLFTFEINEVTLDYKKGPMIWAAE